MATTTVLKGLAAIQAELGKRSEASQSFDDKPKARYLSIKDGETVKLVFLQEIDEGSPHYSAKNGTAIFPLTHSNPEKWQKTAKCTADLGDCYGCDHNWKQKVGLFINVLVDDGEEEPYVALWNRGLGKGSVANTLLEMAGDEDFDYSITNKTFKFSRKGKTKDDTTYTLTAMPKEHSLNVEDYDLYDLEAYVFTVQPERQETYYTDGQSDAAAPAAAKAPSAAAVDAEW